MNKAAGCIVLCALLAGCGGGGEPAEKGPSQELILRGRAEAFGSLLISIQGMPETEARMKLAGFIEPSPTQAERIAKYHSEFSASSKKFRIVSQSVELVTIHEDRASADVTYRTVARAPTGDEIPVTQKTQWKLVDGAWYRTIGEAEKDLAR